MPAATLRTMFTWWAEQMASLVPRRLRAPPDREPDSVVLTPGDPGQLLEVASRERGSMLPIASVSPDASGFSKLARLLRQRRALPVTLLAPEGGVLERSATLPLLAEKDAAQALAYEMDRLTPFTADEVFWTWSVLSRDRAQARLRLRLALVPKARWSALIEALGRAGVVPGWIEGRGADGVLHRIPLDARDAQHSPRLRVALAAGCAALAITALVLPLALQTIALSAGSSRIDALRPAVARVEAIRRQIAASSTGLDVIAAETARLGSPLAALATLTDVLPDDTYLTDFAMHQRKLTLNGQSAAATRLIGALSADPGLRNPAFVAPVTRSENGKADLFAIRTELGS